MKEIIIINGTGGSGKDTFVQYVNYYAQVYNFSSVAKVKEIAQIIGWDGISKTEKDTTLKTNAIESKELPPDKSPTIKTATCRAKINKIKKQIMEITAIIMVPNFKLRTLASFIFLVSNSLTNLLIATGIPADEIFKNITYIL